MSVGIRHKQTSIKEINLLTHQSYNIIEYKVAQSNTKHENSQNNLNN